MYLSDDFEKENQERESQAGNFSIQASNSFSELCRRFECSDKLVGVCASSSNVFPHEGAVSSEARARQFGQLPRTLWLTGLSGAGKSTIAYALEQLLMSERRPCIVLDGDNLRHRLNRDLGFSVDDRQENIRRVSEVARLMNDVGLIAIVALISPYRADRAIARNIIGQERFVEIYVSTPLDICESRDPKGLYRRARRGEISDFTGVSSPYEPPPTPTVIVDTAVLTMECAVAQLYTYLKENME